MSSSSLPESGTCMPPQLKLQVFDENVQLLKCFTEKQFLECLRVSSDNSEIPDLSQSLSIDDFCSLANDISQSIKARRAHHLLCIYLFLPTHDFSSDFMKYDLLVFKDTGNKIDNGHITGSKCRPDIIAAFEKDWLIDASTDWALIRLAGDRASRGKSFETLKKNAATYLHSFLLARPDFLVAQGLLITTSGVMFLVGIGGVGIQHLTVKWHDKNLYTLLYAFIYRLYDPSHFADPLFTRTGFNEETSEVTYTVQFKMKECPDFRNIYARNPFTIRTHVFSNPSPTKWGDRFPTVLKEQLCRTRRRFDERTILTKIHHPTKVPGVVEAVGSEIIVTPLSPGRVKHRLGLQQMRSPFTSIPTAKKVLETLFDLLEGI